MDPKVIELIPVKKGFTWYNFWMIVSIISMIILAIFYLFTILESSEITDTRVGFDRATTKQRNIFWGAALLLLISTIGLWMTINQHKYYVLRYV
jgi:magnesium-transporting ATPase (P-type)